jgi:Zn-dependent protease with chaperone function
MSTDFFQRQQHLRRMSVRLVLLFAIAVVGIIVTVDLVALLAFGAFSAETDSARLWGILALASLATAGAIALATLYRTATLRGGGARVARELGGDYVPHDTVDPQLRRLRNVVEEIAIASGVPVPEIYVLPNEAAINAFAAGWSTSDAVVAVTRGALERLNRDELQGVIAHEFSHVVNGDMRLNIRLMGLLFGILFLAVAGETILRAGAFGRSRDEKGGNPLPLIGFGLIIAGWVGVLIGRVIKASVSRKREYLADTSAVQYTRNPQGIAGALKKIAGLPAGSGLKSPKGEEVAHMLFGRGSKKGQSLFATHPPLPDRIKALDPTFDVRQLDALSRQWAQHPPVGMEEDVALGLAPAAPSNVPSKVEGDIVARVGNPTEHSYQQAGSLLQQIPEDLRARIRNVDQVVPVVLGLLLSGDAQVRARQTAALSAILGPNLTQASVAEADLAQRLNPLLRLPLAELAFPALRHRPPESLQALLNAVHALIHADERISVFEYCFSVLLHTELTESMNPKPHWRSGARPLRKSRDEVILLLSVLAGDDSASGAAKEGAEAAFRAGMEVALPGDPARFMRRDVVELDTAWPALRELDPPGKEQLVRALVVVIHHDRQVSVHESELLRTVCALLHCPLPPLAVTI